MLFCVRRLAPTSLTPRGICATHHHDPHKARLVRLAGGYGALLHASRHRSFHFYLNLEDPAETRRHVEEELDKLADHGRKDTTAYLHALLNLALAYYHAEDHVKAHEFARYTHEQALQRRANSALVYLTATTCAHCAKALAAQYEAHVQRMQEAEHTSVSLAPRPSVVFSAERAIRKLREDGVRFEGIANRLYNRPDLAFLRGFGSGRFSSRSSSGGGGTHTHRDTRTGWSEDVSTMDEGGDEDARGVRWSERRKRPEHVELRRFHKKQQQQCSSSSQWTIPR